MTLIEQINAALDANKTVCITTYAKSIQVKATVKSHWTAGDGRKATYINRPVIC